MPTLPKALRAASASELKERLDAARRGAPFVLYREADGDQRLLALDESAHLSIGRQQSSDVPLPWDTAVSRVHAALERVGEEWTLVDDGSSRNGSFLNGERLHGRRRLKDGDVIRVGSTTIAFVVPDERAGGGSSTVAATTSGIPTFTAAQRRVLLALCRPLVDSRFGAPSSNQQIAGELFLGVETVKSHMQALFEAFAIQGLPQNRKRAELARLALSRGAVREDELLGGDARAGADGG